MAALTVFPACAGRALAFPVDDPSPVGRVLTQVYQESSRSIVQVTAYRPYGPSPQASEGAGRLMRIEPFRKTLRASGVVCGLDGCILTCAEAAQPGDSLEIETSGGLRSPARFLAQDPALGVSLIQAEDPHHLLAVPVAHGIPCRPGDWLLVVSFGEATDRPSLRLGTWDAPPVDSPHAYPYLRLDLADCRGTCGAAVIDGSGAFRGMIISPRVERDAETRPPDSADDVRILECDGAWALNRDSLDSLRVRLMQRSRQGTGYLGVQAEPVDDLPSPEDAAAGRRPQLRIVRILPGSPAELAGVQVDDLILEINGQSATSVAQINNLITALPPGTDIQLDLLRRGASVRLVARLVDRSALDWLDREDQLNQLRTRRLQRSVQRLQDRIRQLGTPANPRPR